MANGLGRSKSTTGLRPSHRNGREGPTSQQRAASQAPHSRSKSQKAPATITRSDSAVNMPQPHAPNYGKMPPGGLNKTTSNGRPKHIPIVIASDEQDLEKNAISTDSPKHFFFTAEVRQDEAIGMALGSPTHPTPLVKSPESEEQSPSTVSSSIGTPNSSTMPPRQPSPQPAQQAQQQRPKNKGWRSLFGRKNERSQSPPPPFYNVQYPADSGELASNDSFLASNKPSEPSPLANASSVTPDSVVSPGQGRRGKTAPFPDSPKTSPLALRSDGSSSQKSDRKGKEKEKRGKKTKVPQVTITAEGGDTSTPGDPPLLNVDIPDVHMERYSVMFGNVLTARNSSLLLRRQNTDKLKPLENRSLSKHAQGERAQLKLPQRRATSPSRSQTSPSVGCFPSSSPKSPFSRTGTLHRPRPMQRSKTVPTNTVSTPSDYGEEDDDDDLSAAEPSPINLHRGHLSPEPGADREAGQTAKMPKSSTWKPIIEEKEPEWEIVSKPPKPQGLPAHPKAGLQRAKTERLSPRKFESQPQQESPQPQIVVDQPKIQVSTVDSPIKSSPSPEKDRAEEAQKARERQRERRERRERAEKGRARDGSREREHSRDRGRMGTTQVGVARTVSLSRPQQQRKDSSTLLKPHLASPDRIVDQKPLTPTLVELKNRKSQRVQIVEADA